MTFLPDFAALEVKAAGSICVMLLVDPCLEGEFLTDLMDDAALPGLDCCILLAVIAGALSSTSQLHYSVISEALSSSLTAILPERILPRSSYTVCMACP